VKEIAIRITDLHKAFPHRDGQITAFKRLSMMARHRHRPEPLPALTAIDLAIPAGSKVALIGNNGAGKSTLLRTLAGIYRPTRGTVEVDGKLTILAGWGVGLIDDLTVRENIYLYGAIYGLTRTEISERLADILEWAELEEFETSKLHTLSSGMRTRLGFSTVRHVESDIFLLDEAFSAGDQDFREKCDRHFQEEKNGGRTFLIATHSLGNITSICSEAMWLDKGRLIAYGPADDVIAEYKASKKQR
jgi:ABC-type polysaccharide/polyol phosphate transport system ATPase subunit